HDTNSRLTVIALKPLPFVASQGFKTTAKSRLKVHIIEDFKTPYVIQKPPPNADICLLFEEP
ncbi:hypothetical protein NPIL_594421, partial [Nephila pilipes]